VRRTTIAVLLGLAIVPVVDPPTMKSVPGVEEAAEFTQAASGGTTAAAWLRFRAAAACSPADVGVALPAHSHKRS
jgi:hypothetical protein